MIRTIIADDDFLVRSYLKQLQAWGKAEYEIVSEAHDGEEALKEIEELGPDLIVTDISMPLLDGIELIRKIRERNNSVYIIVLSCHDDFEYVKEAMKLGADEYLLKNSLNEESLYEILENTKKQISSRREKYRGNDEEKRLLEMGRNTLKYHFFNGLLAGSFSSVEREQKRNAAGITADYHNSAVVNMFLPEWGVLKSNHSELELEQYSQRFLLKLSEELRSREEDASHVECVYLGEGVFCCFVDLSEIRRSVAMRQRLTGIATACFRCCREEKYEYGVGVSNVCFGEEGIRQAYQQAREVMKLSFYEKGNILYYEGCPEIGKILPEEADILLEKAVEIINEDNEEKFKNAFDATIKAFCQAHTDVRLILHWLRDLDESLDVRRVQEEYAGIVQVEQLENICENYLQKLFVEKHRAILTGSNPAVRLAIDFMHIHYKEAISLTEVAEAAGLNSAYLSYLFKQEVGQGFSEYLLNLRMTCAERLLHTTNDKVKDVAADSGFGDYHYFSKVFKKEHGKSPAEYRKEVSIKNM